MVIFGVVSLTVGFVLGLCIGYSAAWTEARRRFGTWLDDRQPNGSSASL